ncbi:protein phosphatase 1 regulatory subunit 15B [Melanotaenia boesemani]|uniref:protein phosphatase 1 regulatory subunit 15B n=1 Tax=Melanotaenia boesemani TaxID=1250792 RepID=UPI001C05AEB4|nr:protein phosphatase 1 regulatory subunit 15B [Melanotaenia boesemani]
MATSVVSEKGSERTAMESFGSGGMALLPWTKQMLTVLWEQLRLLVQVIYYTFMSVFQMFRFEVHVRITDETGEHIQHMSTAANSPETFLFSSVVSGSNPLSNFCADTSDPFTGKSTAEALLSSLRADDLCCGLVDDFVSASKEDGIFLGHQSTWKMGFPGDWNIFVSSSDSCSSNNTCHKSKEKVFKQDLSKEKVSQPDTSEEERSFHWSSEEEQNIVEFESEESKALWESLSKSSDPYNPFFFSACISTSTDMGKIKGEMRDNSEADLKSASKASKEMLGSPGLNMWVCRSDSESSWAGSEGSGADFDKEENDRLWEFFSSPEDPYNPMCFTASTVSCTSPQTTSKQQASLPAPPPKFDTDTEEKESSFPPSEDDEEELMWKSLCQKNDPYHPLNFKAGLQSSTTTFQHDKDQTLPDVHHTKNTPTKTKKQTKAFRKPREVKPALPERQLKKHCHPDKTLAPWKRPKQSPQTPPEKKENKASTTQKKVQFSPLVQVHVMHTWPFARQASRKGHWEEMARDRDRFRRRILELEKVIGHCFSHSHREKIRAYLDGALKNPEGPVH